MWRGICCLAYLCMPVMGCTDTFKDYQAFARSLQGSQQQAVNTFKEKHLPPDLPDVSEQRAYYDDPDQLKSQSEAATKKDECYVFLKEQRQKREPVLLDETINSFGKDIEANANAIVDGVANPVTPARSDQKPIFCRTGDCNEYAPQPNQDFQKATGALATLVGAARSAMASGQIDPDAMKLFDGKVMECSDDMAGYKNCCRDTGWGKDIHLAHCTDREKQLGQAKEQGRAIYVGKRCAHHVRFGFNLGCSSWHRQYCVFPSKMARLVQAQGRYAQLHKGFGSSKHPDCRGLTLTEFSTLDLGTMDFSALAEGIMNEVNLPDNATLLNMATRTIGQTVPVKEGAHA